jgi:hypothetical protein
MAHTRCMLDKERLHGNVGFLTAPQCYVIRTLFLLLTSAVDRGEWYPSRFARITLVQAASLDKLNGPQILG